MQGLNKVILSKQTRPADHYGTMVIGEGGNQVFCDGREFLESDVALLSKTSTEFSQNLLPLLQGTGAGA